MIVYIESLSPLYEFCIVCYRELAPCTVGLTWRRVYGDDIQRFGSSLFTCITQTRLSNILIYCNFSRLLK